MGKVYRARGARLGVDSAGRSMRVGSHKIQSTDSVSLSHKRRARLWIANWAIVSLAFIPGSNSKAAGTGVFLRPGAFESGGYRVYLHGPDSPRRANLPDLGPGSEVGLSPSGTLIAYTINRTGNPGIQRGSSDAYEVAVVDTAGHRVTSFPRAIRFAWNPAGDTLAVAIGRTPWEILSGFDSILVWSPHGGMISQGRVSARRGPIGWAGPDTVLAGSWPQGPVDAIPLKTGVATVSNHRGTNVSPNGRFSFYPRMGGLGVGVWDDRTGANFAYSSVELLGFPRLGEIGPTRWVRSGLSGNALAISACTPSNIGPKGRQTEVECLTGLIDAGSTRLLGWTRGRLIAMSSNAREVVVARDTSIVLVGEGDWEQGPVPTQTSPWPERRSIPSPRRVSPVLAFTAYQIRCCDNGRFAVPPGYHFGPVYTVGSDGQTRVLLHRPSGYWPSEAALNRTGDLIAIAGRTNDSDQRTAVFVADTSGAIVETFADKVRFRWDRDGTRLALIGKDVAVWDRWKGVTSRLSISADDEAWTASGSLMLRSHDRVVQFDPRSGDTTSTNHMAVDVSPDGRYSLDGTHWDAGPRVFDDVVRANITKCAWGEVRDLAGGLSGDPFWSPDPNKPHHLWVNKCDSRLLGIEEGKLSGCEFTLIDVDRMEQVDAIEGKLLGRTPDGRSIVVLRGNAFSIVSLEPRIGEQPKAKTYTARGASARIQAVVLEWSSWRLSRTPSKSDTVGVYTVDVRESEWLPDWSGSNPGCGRGMKVRQISNAGSVEIEYGGGWLGAGIALLVPGSETRLTTNSSDGGRYLHLRVIR